MKSWHLITYKQFENRKLIDKMELIETDNITAGLNRVKSLNAQKRLTTTDYRIINLTKLLADNALEINALINK